MPEPREPRIVSQDPLPSDDTPKTENEPVSDQDFDSIYKKIQGDMARVSKMVEYEKRTQELESTVELMKNREYVLGNCRRVSEKIINAPNIPAQEKERMMRELVRGLKAVEDWMDNLRIKINAIDSATQNKQTIAPNDIDNYKDAFTRLLNELDATTGRIEKELQ